MKLTLRKRSSLLFAVASVLSSALVASGQPAPEPTSRELLDEVRALRARVETLEQRPPSQVEIDNTKSKIAADVASKGNVFLKYDKDGLLLSNDDATFTMRPTLLFTLRYVYSNTEDSTTAGAEENQDNSGFEVRRFKFSASGTALTKQLSYGLDITSAASGGAFTLNDAFFAYQLGEKSPFYVKGGQYKSPFAHEEMTPDSLTVAAESSLVSETIGGRATGRVQGVSLMYNNGKDNKNPWNGYLMFADGDKSLNTDYRQGANNKFSAYARGEYKVTGDWKSYNNLSHLDSKEDLLVFGAAVAMSQGEDTVYRFTVDGQYEFADKWALYAGILGAQTNRDTGDDGFDTGAVAQLAYIIDPNWELFGRYSVTKYDSDQPNGVDRTQEYTIGANYLLGEDGKFWRQARLTIDLGYLPDGCPANFAAENYMQSEGPQFVSRIQFRLLL